MPKATCGIDGCDKPVHAHKMCNKHYRRHAALTAPRCSIGDCASAAIARQMCPKHYERWRQHGDATICRTSTIQERPPCSVDGCLKDASARGWCKRHYERWRLHGDPHATRRKVRPWAAVSADAVEWRTCASCNRNLPLFEFAPHRKRPERLDTCRKCVGVNRKDRYGPGLIRDQRHYKLLRTFGLSITQYEQMTVDQEGRCAICRELPYGGRKDARKKFLSVDHCHTTGKIRGLLCDQCNFGLGQFKDEPSRLQAAIEYLTRTAS